MSEYLYTHNNTNNGNGSQVERTKVIGYLSLFLFIIFCGLNRIGFHHIDLKGLSDIIRILRAISIDWNFLSIIRGQNCLLPFSGKLIRLLPFFPN